MYIERKEAERRFPQLEGQNKGKLEDGNPIGGRGHLSDERIKQIQRYYGLAIRQNNLTTGNPSGREVNMAVYSMKKNVIAILNHSVKAEDSAKQDRFCPPGESSWCKWQQDQASGTSTYQNDDCLPEIFLELLCPTFMTPSETKLLERCVRGTTENRDECINSLVWVRCPKHKHHGVKVICCAVALLFYIFMVELQAGRK